MSNAKDVIHEAASRIVALVKSRASGTPEATVAAMRRLCKHDFGVPARSIDAPLDYFGEVRGDIGGDDAVIIFNSAQPERIQIRVLLHELAEYIAARDMPGLWDATDDGAKLTYEGSDAPEDVRHQVALAVEETLARDMGIEDVKPNWTIADILRVIPLDPKYTRPNPEIEYLPPEE
ncbi:MAG TPA: hypothetical protein VGK19_23085 [Capsulimonadaceae bacterium]|jgi:hypothetical protein